MRKLKIIIGKLIWRLSYPSAWLRRLFRPLGLRTTDTWFEGETATLYLPEGKNLKLTGIGDNFMTFLVHWNAWRFYEPITLLLVNQLIKDKKILLYGGANIGYYALAASAQKPELKVFGFEPNPKLFAKFQENVRLNHLNVTCEQMAMSNSSGTATFHLSPSDMSGSLEGDFQREHTGTVTVPTSTVDDYLEKQGQTSGVLIKLIVEGHEAKVLQGARRTLAQPDTELILGVAYDYDPETMAYLKSFGYRFYELPANGFHPKETLTLCRQGDYVYFDYFITRKLPAEVHRIYEKLLPEIKKLDLTQTSHYRPDWDDRKPY